jgi:hypothetical protein
LHSELQPPAGSFTYYFSGEAHWPVGARDERPLEYKRPQKSRKLELPARALVGALFHPYVMIDWPTIPLLVAFP